MPLAAPSTAGEVKGKPGRQAMIARERACGKQWREEKAAGKIIRQILRTVHRFYRNAGFAAPYALVASLAVTVNVAAVTVSVPFKNVNS